MTDQQVPEGRYGARARRTPNRKLRWALSALALVVCGLLAFVAYTNLGSEPIKGTAVTYTRLDDNSVQVTIEVQRDRPQRPAVCVLRSLGLKHREVGRREILVPPGDSTVHRRAVVTTSAPPATGEVYGCSYNVPAYLSTGTRPTG